MRITLKLYGKLANYLPENASKNQAVIEILENANVEEVLDNYGIPSNQRQIVMVNGTHIKPEERGIKVLSETDSLAVWPPTTG